MTLLVPRARNPLAVSGAHAAGLRPRRCADLMAASPRAALSKSQAEPRYQGFLRLARVRRLLAGRLHLAQAVNHRIPPRSFGRGALDGTSAARWAVTRDD
jgi:hypothetical protein